MEHQPEQPLSRLLPQVAAGHTRCPDFSRRLVGFVGFLVHASSLDCRGSRPLRIDSATKLVRVVCCLVGCGSGVVEFVRGYQGMDPSEPNFFQTLGAWWNY